MTAQPRVVTNDTPASSHTRESHIPQVTIAEISANLPEYFRDDWQHWTDAYGDCQDALNEVLLAVGRAAASYRTDTKRWVASIQRPAQCGGTVDGDTGDLDINHMVPLRNAHMSGDWG